MKNTWILIANASEARLFQTEKSTKELELLHEYSHPQSREKIINLVSDRPGSYRNGKSPKSVFDEPSNPKKVEAERFAHKLAGILDAGRTKNLYKHLIIIAPSHFQGLLNKCFNIQIKNLVTNTLDKDYTKLKKHELPEYLNGKLSFKKAA